jgi:hypothetical protein
MIIGLDSPKLVDVDLVSDVEAMLGQAVPLEDRESGRFRAGEIFTRRLTQKTAHGDEELASFIRQDAGSFDYYFIRIVCTFIDKAGQQFESAWIKVDLTRQDCDDLSDSQPVAWSVEPDRLTKPSGIVRSAEVTVPAKLVTATYGRKIAVADEVYLWTKFVGSSRPTWYLKRTHDHPIDGDVDLRIVARVPSGIQACAEVTVGAGLQNRIRRVADLPSSFLRRACFGRT